MPTFYSRKLHHDLYILLDQEMLKLIFTNTLKHFSSRAAHANKIISVQMTAKFTEKKALYRDQDELKNWLQH